MHAVLSLALLVAVVRGLLVQGTLVLEQSCSLLALFLQT
jgi:hypothetical protein